MNTLSKNSCFITQQYLEECFSYDCITGILSWKTRPVWHFKNKSYADRWNKRFAHKIAGSLIDIGERKCRYLYLNNRNYTEHRIIWRLVFGFWPLNIDHINGDASDNRIENLRNVTHGENMKNLKLQINNKTGVPGVFWYERYDKYQVKIQVNRKRIHLGYFSNFNDAVNARKAAEILYDFHENHGRKRYG